MHNFYQLYYHFVWSTKHRQPHITVEVENLLRTYVPAKTLQLGGFCYQLGMTENHVHVLVTIPPSTSVASFIQKIKGGSAYLINKTFLGLPSCFQWQNGYGVISFSGSALPVLERYVTHQKEHHQNHTMIKNLEISQME